MRIALVVPRYAPAVGGVEWHAQMLASHLVELGVSVDVICTDPGSRTPSRTMIDGVSVRRFPTVMGDKTFLISPSLRTWLGRNAGDYDLVHAHSYHTPLPVLAAMASRRSGTPLVVTPHFHGTGHTWRRRLLHVPYRLAAGWMLRRAVGVICVSDAERRLLHSRFRVPSQKVVVIPNGVDLGEFANATPVTRDAQRRTVLTVGRLEAYKGTLRTVRAAAFIPGDMELVVIGDGSEAELVRAAAVRAGLGDRFLWYPSLPREELLGWYRTADVFVSMSGQEAFGITLLEAAVAGARVVASDIAPHREVAGFLPPDAVSLVDPSATDEELALAIVKAASAGPVTGADGTVPTWRKVAEQTLHLYARVISHDTTRG